MWPENWPAVQVFKTCATQWRLDSHDRRRGLDYTAVESVMRMLRIDDPADALMKLRAMEAEVIRRQPAPANPTTPTSRRR